MYRKPRLWFWVLLMVGAVPAQSFAQQVTLTANTTKSVYAHGEAVTVRLLLKNNGSAPVAVSPRWLGNVVIAAVTRNGAHVAPRMAPIVFEEDLGVVLRASLEPLAAGATATIEQQSELDAGQGSQALKSVPYANSGRYVASLFGIGLPGSYIASLTYHYTAGPGALTVAPFTGAINAKVSFKVSP